MKAKLTARKTNTIYVLEISPDVALWLKYAIQNPLCEHESLQDSEIRKSLWNALPTIEWLTRETMGSYERELKAPDNV